MISGGPPCSVRRSDKVRLTDGSVRPCTCLTLCLAKRKPAIQKVLDLLRNGLIFNLKK